MRQSCSSALPAIALAIFFAPMLGGPASAAAQGVSVVEQFDAKVAAAKGAMMSDPGIALRNARDAIAIGKTLPGKRGTLAVTTGQWLEGESLVRLNRVDEGRMIIDVAIATVERREQEGKLHADLLKSKAAIAGLSGNVQSALTTLHYAHRIYAKLGDARSQAIVFQNIGSIYSEARDYPRVLYYYELANETYAADPKLALSSHNNRGNAFKEMGKLPEALSAYGIALRMAREADSPLLEARIMTNIASAQFLNGKLAKADAEAVAGLRRATGDASEWRPYLWGVRAQVAVKRGDFAAAKRYLQETFAGADLSATSTLYRDFHETAFTLYARLGNHELALEHLKAFKRLDDEARGLAASAQSGLLAAQFDASNRELRIARLKSERLASSIELAETSQWLRFVTLLSVLAGLIIVAVSFGLATARRARRTIAATNGLLSHAANHDHLTQLPNRGYMRQLLTSSLESAEASGGGCAMFLIDLDHFKAVNDTLGHQAGDRVLCTVAERLKEVAAKRGHAARLGGDEFGLFVPFSDLDNEPVGIADDIIAKLGQPIDVDGRMVSIGATVGIATFPLDAHTVDGLTRCADLALYHAKDEGRGCRAQYAVYMQTEIDERRRLETDLRDAIGNGELAIAYQPIVDADTTDVVAYEALLRWEHPVRGTVPPSVFIPVAEETKQISEIGRWVLRTACAEAATWPEHIKLAVNLSAIQIEGVDFTANVVHALAAHGLTTDRLELEVTESVFLRRGPNTESTLARLQALGISLALDDFGTGFSSLSYLERASFATIKIDRGFVQSAAEGRKESLSIIRAIVALADGLGMKTTAEGVENEAQVRLMRELGCSQFQGFHFGRPVVSRRELNRASVAKPSTAIALRRANRRAE